VEVPARDLAEWATRLRRALDTNVATFGEIPPFDTITAHRLYAALLRPVEEAWLGARSLLVVPDGALAQVPFAVLVTERHEVAPEREGEALFAPYARVPWLARRVAVSRPLLRPSLVTLRGRPSARLALSVRISERGGPRPGLCRFGRARVHRAASRRDATARRSRAHRHARSY